MTLLVRGSPVWPSLRCGTCPAVTGNLSLAWLAMLRVPVVTAVVAFRLDRESLCPLWRLPRQQFVYGQLPRARLTPVAPRDCSQRARTVARTGRSRSSGVDRTGLGT
jgi:hypothetical protein